MKKIKSIILITVITILLFSACAKPANKNTSPAGAVNISDINEFPITDEEVTLRIFMPKQANIENLNTNEFTKYYEEKTGVKIQWDLISGDINQAINLKLASDDLSDIWIGFSFADSEQAKFYEQGAFIDLTKLVDEYGYYIKDMFKKEPETEKALRHTNNLLIGLPNLSSGFSAEAPNKMWIYEPWLKKLGLSVPTTVDEFYDVLKAFKELDPNGNGIADEVPLAARNVRGGQIGLDMFLMNCFTDWGQYGLVNDNGKASFCAITSGAKEGMKYIHKLYKDGLIHPESFVMDRARVTALAESEPPVLGAAPGMWTTQFTSPGTSTRMNEYVAVPPLKNDVSTPRTQASDGVTSGTSFSITTDCKYPEIAIKWIDYLYSQEGYIKASAEEGTRLAKKGEIGLDGKQAIMAVDTVEGSGFDILQNKKWPFIPTYFPRENSIKTAYNTVDAKRQKNAYAAYEMYKPYEVYDRYVGDFPMPTDVCEEYLELRKNITAAIDNGFIAFVIGEKDIEKDWDSYVQNFYDLGLNRYLEIFQNYLDAQK